MNNMATVSCPSLEELLSHHGLQREDLESVCPQEVRDRIALKLEDWKMVGRCLKFPPEKLKAIDRENETEDQRRVALLDNWGKREGKGATYLKLAEVLHQRGRSDLVEMLCDELRKSIVPQKHAISKSMESKEVCATKDIGNSPVVIIDAAERIETLEGQFDSLHQQLLFEITENEALSGMELLRALTMLPVSLRKEYESSIQQMLPALEGKNTITELFLRLSPLFVFVDYGLLHHLISKFGSTKLQEDMKSYVSKVQVFMQETTVADLIDYWPGDEPLHLNYSKLRAKFSDDPKTYTLQRLNNFRRKFCSKIRLSELIFGLISLEAGESFFATWVIPTIIAPELMKAIREIDSSFYQTEHVLMISLGQELLYQFDGLSTDNETLPKDCDTSLHPYSLEPAHCQDQFWDSEVQRESIEEDESVKLNTMIVEKNREIQALIAKVREVQAEHRVYKNSVQEFVPVLSEKIRELVAFMNENIHMEERSGKKLENLKTDLQDLTVKLESVANSKQIQADEEREWGRVAFKDECVVTPLGVHHRMEDLLLTKQQYLSQWLQETLSIPSSVDDSGLDTATYEPSIASEFHEPHSEKLMLDIASEFHEPHSEKLMLDIASEFHEPHSEKLMLDIATKQEELAKKELEVEILRVELETLRIKQLKTLQKLQKVEKKRIQSVTSTSTDPSKSAIHKPLHQTTSSDIRLHTARRASVLKKLLNLVKDHNSLDSYGNAPLHCCVHRNDKGKFDCLMIFLIYSNCDVNLLNKEGQTALHLSCRMNDIMAAKALIAFDARVNSVNTFNETPLDIVLNYHPNTELEYCLLLLGAMLHKEMVTDQEMVADQEMVTDQEMDTDQDLNSREKLFMPMPESLHHAQSYDSICTIVGMHRETGGHRILCLDGGGMKCLVQIEMLKTFEQMTGKSISELFDWVVGTSFGGILALGMIYGGLSLAQLRCVYFKMKDTVFKQQSKFISHTYDANALEDLLKRILSTEKRMDCIRKPNVLITAVKKATTSLPLIFFNNCFDDNYSNELVWKVARYTSATPSYFGECDNYVDGGVVANNPTTFALSEIQDFLFKKHGYMSPDAKISCVVSLGCGIYPPEPLGNTDLADALKITKLYSAPRRLNDLLKLFANVMDRSVDMARLCRINCEQQGISYFRFNPEMGEDVGTAEKDNRKLCEIIVRTKQMIGENREQVEEMIRILGCSVQDEYLFTI